MTQNLYLYLHMLLYGHTIFTSFCLLSLYFYFHILFIYFTLFYILPFLFFQELYFTNKRQRDKSGKPKFNLIIFTRQSHTPYHNSKQVFYNILIDIFTYSFYDLPGFYYSNTFLFFFVNYTAYQKK